MPGDGPGSISRRSATSGSWLALSLSKSLADPEAYATVMGQAEVDRQRDGEALEVAVLGEDPRAGTARYRHRPTPDRLLTDELQFCATCAVIIANGDTSGDGAEHAAEQIERRWRDSGGHLVVSGGPDDHEPAWTVFDCDGCGNPTAAHPVPGVLLRA